MKRDAKYKLIIGLLAILVVLEAVLFLLTRAPKRAAVVSRPQVLAGKIAIVLDDWGYNLDTLGLVEQIKYPLTVSVLPNLAYSRQAGEKLHDFGLEVILHLPLEPHEKYRLEKNTIMVGMKEAEITDIFKNDLASIPYAKGVSNHMGSRATEDKRTTEIIFKELRKKNLYYLDSVATANSVCMEVAQKIGVKFARRSVFLDNKLEPAYIKEQLNKLKSKAKNYGRAIGIGHDRKVTLAVLKEMMPILEKEGYKFVFVSNLVN